MWRTRVVALIISWVVLGLPVSAHPEEPAVRTFDIPEECQQVVLVYPTDDGYAVDLITYDEGREHREQFAQCSIGHGGIAPLGHKREGDGRTPEGVYPLRRGLCYVSDFYSRFPMEQYDENDMWSEDPTSPDYNTLVRDPQPEYEGDRLWERRETLYRYIVVVEYNTEPIVAGAGSAIFIHAWRSQGQPTAGCIGMEEKNVRQLVEWLDVDKHPHIVILNEE